MQQCSECSEDDGTNPAVSGSEPDARAPLSHDTAADAVKPPRWCTRCCRHAGRMRSSTTGAHCTHTDRESERERAEQSEVQFVKPHVRVFITV